MKSGQFPAGAVRALALAVPSLVLLSGCEEDRYPGDLSYPLRTDAILVSRSSATPFYPAPPGHIGQPAGKGQARDEDEKTRDPGTLPADDRKEIGGLLAQYFGTPAEPLVGGAYDKLDPDAKEMVDKLELEPGHLKDGSQVYRRHCLHCHGLAGDGRGPTGPWINPHPRDYRQGVFKFISTATAVKDSGGEALQRKARRQDLLRTLKTGIDGTSMPSFGLLPEQELEDLASYVIHLSLRGQVEMDLMSGLLGGEIKSGDIKDKFDDRFQGALKAWRFSDEERIEPRPYQVDGEQQRLASVKRGFAVFRGKGACIGCHVDYGRQVPFRYDDWGTLVRPANLTTGIYRGGRRPVDLYWRVVGGIPPSQMPAAEDLLKRDQAKNTDDAWDLVNFLHALPYPQMLPEDVRKEVYEITRHEPGR